MNKNEIIVIGAGASGLMAAMQLVRQGWKVTVLEARTRLGGRIHTVREEGYDCPVELGAEFIHGEPPFTAALLNEAGIVSSKMEGGTSRVTDGVWSETEEIVEGWDKLLERMAALEGDLTLKEFLQRYFATEEHRKLRQQAIAFAGGFDAADAAKVSVKGLWKEWSKEDAHTKKINGGYGVLIDYLASEIFKAGGDIETGCVVKQIRWQKGRAEIRTQEGNIHTAAKIIVTIPVSLLTATEDVASVDFFPSVEQYRRAAADIGFGNVLKMLLFFKEAFWKPVHADAGFVLSDEKIPVWWTSQPFGDPVLTAYIGGPSSGAFQNQSEEKIRALAVECLSRIFSLNNQTIEALLKEVRVIDWSKDPFAKGAYSYPMPGTDAARKILMTPLEDTLYFAGEAIYEGDHPATVEAALASGQKVAEMIMATGA